MARRAEIALLLVGFVLVACGPQPAVEMPETVKTIEPSSVSTIVPTAAGPTPTSSTAAMATRPLSSPSPTATATIPPTPTVTPQPTAVPIESQILIEYATTAGDGGDPHTFYLGRAMPSFILYMDGRLLVQEGKWNGSSSGYRRYREARLTSSEMCTLLASVADTGFFNVIGGTGDYVYTSEDPIYDFGDFQNFSEGAPYDLFTVNGPSPKYVEVYVPYWDFVAAEVKVMRDLLNDFSTTATEIYQPEQLMLWVYEGSPEWLDLDLVAQPWPEELPALSQLAAQQAGGYDGSLVEDGFEPLLELLDHRMQHSLFVESNAEYWVIARPLLPHETPDEFPKFTWTAQALPLPFECPP